MDSSEEWQGVRSGQVRSLVSRRGPAIIVLTYLSRPRASRLQRGWGNSGGIGLLCLREGLLRMDYLREE